MWKVPFIRPYVSEETKNKVLEILDKGRETGNFTAGEETKTFEKNLADFLKVKHVLAYQSGTSALYAALVANGIGHGDEVITTTLTFVATAEAIWGVGAKPVLSDIHPEYYTMDLDMVESLITKHTKAIMPVHIYGQAEDMDRLMEISEDKDIIIIEDACQALGGEYKGKKLGTIGDVGAFSFHPQKHLTVCGDGGALATNSDEIAEKTMMIRDHGRLRDSGYDHIGLGYNFRLGELKAGIANVALPHVEGWNKRRREIAKMYKEGIKREHTVTPIDAPYSYHVYDYYVIQTRDRNGLKEYLTKQGIKTDVHYPKAVHQQVVWKNLEKTIPKLPMAEKIIPRILTIPSFPEMTNDDVHYVIENINNYYK